ncbi:hypothetical protein SAMN04487950_4188 [Halogranum rubrum]|uniref:Uncharacterized protein n=1 Tax=Halogranum rubrum TaxID=553466 RepID=A0A1I4INQ8_9EURY|nr:hypothetical protein [Halogranum rubrum]SFL55396.1 hypothetical protein SAMN04487950_4188 [Halogranum rubrum]
MSDRRVSRRTFLSASAVTGLSFVGSGARQSTQRTQTSAECCDTCSTGTREKQTRPLQSDGVDAADEGGNHWLAFAWAKHDAGFGRYESTLHVPCAPLDHDGRIVFFYFPAFQSYSGRGGRNGYILQPVLAWNWGGSGQWEIGTWSGSSAHGFTHSKLVSVSPGDELRAVIQRPDSLPGEWYLEMRNTTTGEVTVSHSHRLDQRFRYTYLTMEANRAYDPNNCSYLPGGTLFDEITLTDWHGDRIYPNWHRRRDESFDCPVSVDVHGTDRVAIDVGGVGAGVQNE